MNNLQKYLKDNNLEQVWIDLFNEHQGYFHKDSDIGCLDKNGHSFRIYECNINSPVIGESGSGNYELILLSNTGRFYRLSGWVSSYDDKIIVNDLLSFESVEQVNKIVTVYRTRKEDLYI